MSKEEDEARTDEAIAKEEAESQSESTKLTKAFTGDLTKLGVSNYIILFEAPDKDTCHTGGSSWWARGALEILLGRMRSG